MLRIYVEDIFIVAFKKLPYLNSPQNFTCILPIRQVKNGVHKLDTTKSSRCKARISGHDFLCMPNGTSSVIHKHAY